MIQSQHRKFATNNCLLKFNCRKYSIRGPNYVIRCHSLSRTLSHMKLKYTILYVESVKATLEFYEKSFGFKAKFLHDAGDYGELDTGETTLSFSSLRLMSDLGKNPARPSPNSPVFEIAFETNDVRQWLNQAIESGATLIQDVKEEPWGQTTSYVSDPNGFLIEICSPVRQ